MRLISYVPEEQRAHTDRLMETVLETRKVPEIVTNLIFDVTYIKTKLMNERSIFLRFQSLQQIQVKVKTHILLQLKEVLYIKLLHGDNNGGFAKQEVQYQCGQW